MIHAERAAAFAWFMLLLASLNGCRTNQAQSPPSVADAWRNRALGASTPSPNPPPNHAAAARIAVASVSDPVRDVVASVNGRTISRDELVGLLIQSRGVDVLEQLIALSLASAQETTVSQDDVDFEYELALRRLSDPLSAVTSGDFDRPAAERVLQTVLASRNMSRDELMVTLRRNAHLRKLVAQSLTLSEEDVQEEYERMYGERVQIRHIQLAAPRDVAQVRERLSAGDDFAVVARRYSANVASAKEGGLLAPFSAADDEVPEALRRLAFQLQPGEIGGPLRVGEWEHLVRRESQLPSHDRPLTQVRNEVKRRVRQRRIDARMRERYEKLFLAANDIIVDPLLRAEFEKRHPPRGSDR